MDSPVPHYLEPDYPFPDTEDMTMTYDEKIARMTAVLRRVFSDPTILRHELVPAMARAVVREDQRIEREEHHEDRRDQGHSQGRAG